MWTPTIALLPPLEYLFLVDVISQSIIDFRTVLLEVLS